MRAWMAEWRCLRCSTAQPHEHPSLELSGSRIRPGSSCPHRCGERKGSFAGVSLGDERWHGKNEGDSKQDTFHARYCGPE